jgi:lactate dehydrogenase-like 2-hydroxyacid dehydrogenase
MTAQGKPLLLVTRILPRDVEPLLAGRFRLAISDTPLTADTVQQCRALAHADALVCAPGDRIDAAVLAHTRALRLVAAYSVGTDHIDPDALAAHRLPLINLPASSATATAEIAIFLMLAVSRPTRAGETALRTRQWHSWSPARFLGDSLAGKRLGIVGPGAIGREVARMAGAFGMQVHYHGRRPAARIVTPARYPPPAGRRRRAGRSDGTGGDARPAGSRSRG